jgi:ubiquitin C-terminal hydrolase
MDQHQQLLLCDVSRMKLLEVQGCFMLDDDPAASLHGTSLPLRRVLLAMAALHDEIWGDNMQQDAQEFLHGLLNQLQVMNAMSRLLQVTPFAAEVSVLENASICVYLHWHIEDTLPGIWQLIRTTVTVLTQVSLT